VQATLGPSTVVRLCSQQASRVEPTLTFGVRPIQVRRPFFHVSSVFIMQATEGTEGTVMGKFDFMGQFMQEIRA